mmetsp:Transcript_29517/g.90477  ORF Transcript_29517/g.90477 Transcript_29517/m.90477 type:complete len:149 (-) Transcript_29517:426-872(-)|eukprot:scaffold169168_cov26-Tisochrysis_lutea.AAC.1
MRGTPGPRQPTLQTRGSIGATTLPTLPPHCERSFPTTLFATDLVLSVQVHGCCSPAPSSRLTPATVGEHDVATRSVELRYEGSAYAVAIYSSSPLSLRAAHRRFMMLQWALLASMPAANASRQLPPVHSPLPFASLCNILSRTCSAVS